MIEKHLLRRAVALIVDTVIVLGSLFIFWSLQTFATPDETGNLGGPGCLLFLASLGFWWAYFAGCEARWGQTVGKALVDLRVIRADGGKAGLSECTMRHLLDFIDFQMFGLPAAIAVSVTPNGQRLGDLWAQTRVVKTPVVHSAP